MAAGRGRSGELRAARCDAITAQQPRSGTLWPGKVGGPPRGSCFVPWPEGNKKGRRTPCFLPKAAPAPSQEGVCGDGHPALLGGLCSSWARKRRS